MLVSLLLLVYVAYGDPAILSELPAPHEYPKKKGSRYSGSRGNISVGSSGTSKDYELLRANGHYRIIVPLSNKFESVGPFAISMSEAVVNDRVHKYFQRLFFGFPIAALAFAFFVACPGPRRQKSRIPLAQLGFGFVFILFSAGTIATLVALYSDSAQDKARALIPWGSA